MVYLSTDSIHKDYSSQWYKKWMKRLGLKKPVYHAKFWEQAMLYEALKQKGMLKPGKKGLGFGVGLEHLVSVFASEGAAITATDQAPDDAAEWDNGQLSHGKNSLFYKNILDRKKFDKNVEFRHHDMNKLEKDFINKYDFTWSNCVIGHLGSMELSEEHLKRHAQYIKYGGFSVLTTELAVSSLTETVTKDSGTIIWRLSDLLRVFNEMLEVDMVASRLKLRLAESEEDYNIYYTDGGLNIIDIIEKKLIDDEIREKVGFSNWAITQLQVVFEKKHLSWPQKQIQKLIYLYDYRVNTRVLKKFIEHNGGDISDYKTTYDTADLNIFPAKKSITIKAKPSSIQTVSVRYTNGSDKPLFEYGLHTPLHVSPVLLATANPINRRSKLHTSGWFSDNRIAAEFSNDSHRALPGEPLEYKFDIKIPAKKGTYSEDFRLVLEDVGDIPKSQVTLNVKAM